MIYNGNDDLPLNNGDDLEAFGEPSRLTPEETATVSRLQAAVVTSNPAVEAATQTLRAAIEETDAHKAVTKSLRDMLFGPGSAVSAVALGVQPISTLTEILRRDIANRPGRFTIAPPPPPAMILPEFDPTHGMRDQMERQASALARAAEAVQIAKQEERERELRSLNALEELLDINRKSEAGKLAAERETRAEQRRTKKWKMLAGLGTASGVLGSPLLPGLYNGIGHLVASFF